MYIEITCSFCQGVGCVSSEPCFAYVGPKQLQSSDFRRTRVHGMNLLACLDRHNPSKFKLG